MSEHLGNKDGKKERVRELINRLHQGEDPEAVKEEFKDVIKGLTPLQIAKIEGEMIRDGMPREEIHRLCDVHLAAMKDAIEGTAPEIPEWHPLRVLLGEHREFLKGASQLRNHANAIKEAASLDVVWDHFKAIENIVGSFKHEELHYQREENVLFPYLEKHGVTEPPAIMWMDHDRIREVKKTLRGLVEVGRDMEFTAFANGIHETALGYHEMISSHFYKENNILFPSSVQVIEDEEWTAIGEAFDDIGYYFVKPAGKRPAESTDPGSVPSGDGMALACAPGGGEHGIAFDSGRFSLEELESLLNTLPIDMTFVDREDKVRYFSQGKERIFVRSKAIIGREVSNCHPQKSVHIVEGIVSDFKSGKRDSAEFWLNLEGKVIHIRYFAVKNGKGEYLGTVEVSQDITAIQKITGEKRLLD